MTDRELMQQALEALEFYYDQHGEESDAKVIAALRERLAQPNEFNPDWDAMAVMVEEQQRMATEIDSLRWRLKAVNTGEAERREWVGLEQSDMPDGDDPIYDDPRFIAGIVWAAKKLLEKNT